MDAAIHLCTLKKEEEDVFVLILLQSFGTNKICFLLFVCTVSVFCCGFEQHHPVVDRWHISKLRS